MCFALLTHVQKYHSLAVKGEKVDLKIERAEDGLRNGQTAVKAEPVDDLNGVSREPAVEKQASSGAAVQGFVPPSIPADGAMPQALTASGKIRCKSFPELICFC